MTHTELEYVSVKAITYPSGKDIECKEFEDKTLASPEQVTMDIARLSEQIADLHRPPFLTRSNRSYDRTDQREGR